MQEKRKGKRRSGNKMHTDYLHFTNTLPIPLIFRCRYDCRQLNVAGSAKVLESATRKRWIRRTSETVLGKSFPILISISECHLDKAGCNRNAPKMYSKCTHYAPIQGFEYTGMIGVIESNA
jgi:hypothetical protein